MSGDNIYKPQWICGYSIAAEIPNALDNLMERKPGLLDGHDRDLYLFLMGLPLANRTVFTRHLRTTNADTWEDLKEEIRVLNLAVFGVEPLWPEPPPVSTTWLSMLEALDPE